MRALAWLSTAAFVVLTAAPILLMPPLERFVSRPPSSAYSFSAIVGEEGVRAENVALVVAFSAFPILALVILQRLPTHPVGWLLMGVGLTFCVGFAIAGYALYGLFAVPGSLPGAELVLWMGQWAWIPGMVLLVLFLLLFPSGVVPSSRWRWAVRATLGVGLLELVAYGLGRDPAAEGLPVRRPIVIAELEDQVFVLGRIGDALLAVVFVVAALSLVARFRHSTGVERQQIKWLAYAAALWGIGLSVVTVAALVWGPLVVYGVASVPLILLLAALPMSAAFAILRYRLYDIDILIKRTLVYGSLSGLLGATYIASVLLLQAALRPLTNGSELAVATSTLATLALFQPLRWRIQEEVDHRFYRSRYDAARTIDQFASRLRDEVEIDTLRSDVLDAVRETMQPAHANLWLRERHA